MTIRSPIIDHAGKRSWSAFSVLVGLLVVVILMALAIFLPAALAERARDILNVAVGLFGALLTQYVLRMRANDKTRTFSETEDE